MDAPQQYESLLLRSFNVPYQPSAWISCVLIFWTGMCILRDLSVPRPWIGIVFTVTTYVPTIFSAGRSILQGSRRARTSAPEAHEVMATARVRARRASFIATTWVVTAIARVILRQWSNRFRIAHVPQRQVLCIVIFLALRHVFDERARKRRGAISLPAEDDEERATDPDPVSTEAAAAETHADAGMHMYRPSGGLLVLSIALCVLSLISEGLLIVFGFFPLPSILQATIPTIIFHIFMLARPDSELALQAQFVNDASFSLELTVIWIATRPFDFLSIRFTPGLLEVVVLSYMSAQYALGLWKTLPRYGPPF